MASNETLLSLVQTCPPHLRREMVPMKYPEGAYLLKEGEQNSFVYLLLSGSVQTYHYTAHGDLFVSYVNTRGRYIFGEIEAIMDTYAPILRNVITLEPSEFLRMPREVFLRWLWEDGDFSLFVMRNLCDNLLRSTEYAITNASQTLKKRCAILLCSNSGKDGTVSFGKDTLAGILSTSLRSTNRILKELREAGIIETEKKTIRILNMDKLRELADQ